MRAVLRGVALGLLVPAVAAVAVACSLTTPTPPPVANQRAFGDADRALTRFDPTELLKQVTGGQGCRGAGGGTDAGGGSGPDTFHRAWVLTCPRIGDDRTIYFLLSDAIEAELQRIATVPGSSHEFGNTPDPLNAVWDIQGNAYLGSMRSLGVNGNGNISIFLSLDLVAP
jgi:hypothetical protein